MDKVVWADLVIFQFPLWWFSLPAILKGWVDRVFAMGFSYDVGRAYENGIFRGKRGMAALTTGAPPGGYTADSKNGDIHQLLLHINRGMLHFIGLSVLPPFIAYGAGRVTPEQRAGYLEAYRQRLLTIDSTPPLFV
jgi:NAD(P)H dehydrogenase (quinone)